MSKLDELLQGVDVEWLPLGKVCNIFNGFAFDSKKFNNEGIGLPLIRIRDVNTGFSNTYYSGEYSEKFIVNNNDILIGMDGDFTAIRWRHGKALLNQRVCRLQDFKSDIHPQFIYYIVQGELDRIHSKIEGTTVKHLSSRDLSKSIIPIPPIEIQQEIVRVLDELTSLNNQLTTELETERQNRKKQFEFFREQLFKFEEGEAELKNLKDVAKISNGKDHKIFKDGSIPVYGSGGIMRYIDTSIYEDESVLIPRKGSIGNIFYVNEPFWTVDTIFYTKINIEIIIPKYFYYFLKTKDLKELNFAGGVPSLTKTVLDKIKIPIPSLEEQERIVKLLDQFDATHTAIEEEITKEIKLRTQQYEYYREKLLSFPQN